MTYDRTKMLENLAKARAKRKQNQNISEDKEVGGSAVSNYTKEQLDRALLGVYDLMTRSLIQNQFIVVGEAARCIREHKSLLCNQINIVIPKKHATPEVISMLKDWATQDIGPDGFTFKIGDVPIVCRFLTGQYDHFLYADSRVYGPEDYKIPNQWEDYWSRQEEFV